MTNRILILICAFLVISCRATKKNGSTGNAPTSTPKQNAVYDPGKLTDSIARDAAVMPDCPDETDRNPYYILGIKAYKEDDSIIESLQISSITHKVENGKIKVKLHVHVIDDNRNFVTGLAKKKILKKWCSLADSSGKELDVNNFRVTEYHSLYSDPAAIALVLDHSGSIGNDRALVMQRAVRNFIRNKNAGDFITIIKFDDKILTECKPSLNTNELLGCFRVSGLNGFGGLTALYDAIAEALNILKKQKNYHRKAVLVMTDGWENSSEHVRHPDILSGMANSEDPQININSIAFGEYVNIQDLADNISLPTGGSFYRICKASDFDFIFRDIYNRVNNYYLVEYEVPASYYLHAVNLKLCLDGSQLVAKNYYKLDGLDLENIYFDFAKWDIKIPREKRALGSIYELLNTNPELNVELRGHTDSIDTKYYNYDLSRKRSVAVMNKLIDMGIDKNRIFISSFGEDLPVADNGNSRGRALNRRVEFRLLDENLRFRTPNESAGLASF